MLNEKVLVIDDEPAFCQMMTRFLSDAKYQAFSASNLEDAIILFRREKPKVIILDVNMPIVNGDKFLPILQGLESEVRVIVVSGFTKDEIEERFKNLNYFVFLKKGEFSLEEIRNKVAEAMRS